MVAKIKPNPGKRRGKPKPAKAGADGLKGGAKKLPARLRSKYGLEEGKVFTLIEVGDGEFLRTGTPGDALLWAREQMR